NGIGHIKAVGNYAGGMMVTREVREKGADEALYLDPETHQYIEETNSSNVLFVDSEGALVTPNSEAILPSITLNSILELAEKVLSMPVARRRIAVSELETFKEMGACGTAVTLAQVEKVLLGDNWVSFEHDNTGGLASLYQKLMAIQSGDSEDPFGWVLDAYSPK
ncbi:branched chain amino acid aminotransferase, partial [Candidatus Marinamargulisbacteria bacterium SCGC AG-439-L15]